MTRGFSRRVIASPSRYCVLRLYCGIVRGTIRHNIIVIFCRNNKKICWNSSRGRYNVDTAKFCVADKRFGECPSERENGAVRKRRSANCCFRHADRSRQSGAKALTLRRSLQAEWYYVFMRAPTCTQNKYYMYIIMRARLPSGFGQCVRKSRPRDNKIAKIISLFCSNKCAPARVGNVAGTTL